MEPQVREKRSPTLRLTKEAKVRTIPDSNRLLAIGYRLLAMRFAGYALRRLCASPAMRFALFRPVRTMTTATGTEKRRVLESRCLLGRV
jgi:hypothetical protein